MRNRVVVTGLGCVSALGGDAASTWDAIVEGRTGIVAGRRSVGRDDTITFQGPMAHVDTPIPQLPTCADRRLLAHLDKVSVIALEATCQALSDAGLIDSSALEDRTAIVYGTATGGIRTIEDAYFDMFAARSRTVSALTVPKCIISGPTSAISMAFGICGPAFTVSSACSSGAHAIGEGVHMIRAGRADIVITGGTEANLCYGTWQSWRALGAMAPDFCRPFSVDRRGMVLGEGAATLILEDYKHARQRGATIYAEVLGVGASADAGHITRPDPNGAVRAIACAHKDASLARGIPLIYSAHGTGTIQNDRAEATALRNFYGADVASLHVMATKAAHGHMLGASGALELLLAILSLRTGTIPPILNFTSPEPECGLNLVTKEAREVNCSIAASASLAFGGLNSALIVASA